MHNIPKQNVRSQASKLDDACVTFTAPAISRPDAFALLTGRMWLVFLASQSPTPLKQLYCKHCDPSGSSRCHTHPCYAWMHCGHLAFPTAGPSIAHGFPCPMFPTAGLPLALSFPNQIYPITGPSVALSSLCNISSRWIEVLLPVAYMCQESRPI